MAQKWKKKKNTRKNEHALLFRADALPGAEVLFHEIKLYSVTWNEARTNTAVVVPAQVLSPSLEKYEGRVVETAYVIGRPWEWRETQ